MLFTKKRLSGKNLAEHNVSSEEVSIQKPVEYIGLYEFLFAFLCKRRTNTVYEK